MTYIVLKKGEGRTLRSGGTWVFDNEIESVHGEYKNGDIVEVRSHEDYYLGRGYINDNSKIRVRILTRNDEEINRDFFYRRIFNAYEYRKKVTDLRSCRLIYSDADRLPGLIIDKFEDILVLEADTLGIDVRKKEIAEILTDILRKDGIAVRGVYERSDAKVRLLEGLERVKGFIGEPFDTNVIIDENGLNIAVNVTDGQKTGYFLDQKFNHLAVRNISKNAKVLDCCTHTGGFALSAAVVAKEVVGIDASDLAIKQAEENAKLNNLTNVRFEVADVFDYLRNLKEDYDVIILDPPAFTKSNNSVKKATKGYKEINLTAMKHIKDGGFLVTCSCSEYMNRELFKKTILEAGNDAHKRLRVVEERFQSPDHPIILGNNVSEYLKCMILQVNQR